MDDRTRARLVHTIAAWPDDAPRGAVSRFCAANRVSRAWFYLIRERIAVDGIEAALMSHPSRPKATPTATEHNLAQIACQTRLELQRDGKDFGPITVQWTMRDRGLKPPSRATLARIFAREGLVKAQPKKRPRSSYRRFVYPLPNACWQIDALDVPMSGGRVGTVFQVIDDNSRLMLASRAARSENSQDAVAVVTTAIARHGVPQRFLSDNGVALNPTRRGYTGALVDYLVALGTETITGRPNKPTTQGKNERAHQPLLQFLAAHPAPADLTELQQLLDTFDDYYNHHRRHQAIDLRTPAEAYTALPKATPPEPPNVEEPDLIRQQTATRTVDARGSVYVARRQFQYGTAHIGDTVHVLHDGTTFHLIDRHGTIIDTHTNPKPDTYIARHKPSKQ